MDALLGGFRELLKTSAPTSSYLFPFLFDSMDRDIPLLLNSIGPGVLFLCDDSIIIQPVAMMTCPASSVPLQFRHRRALPLVRSLPYRRAKQPVNSNCLRFLSVSLGARKNWVLLKRTLFHYVYSKFFNTRSKVRNRN